LSPAILPVVFIRHSLDSFDAAETRKRSRRTQAS